VRFSAFNKRHFDDDDEDDDDKDSTEQIPVPHYIGYRFFANKTETPSKMCLRFITK